MKICGIIAEYNPFHNGHLYQLKRALALSGAEYTVIVMSGNFMQRGIPALTDKYSRTKAALCCGADLVLELPVCYACGSAEYFAAGAVSLLDKLGSITHLCFGSESGDLELLKQLAEIFVTEPAAYQESLRRKLKTGLSFPVARAAAILEVFPEFTASLPVLSSPNNILGMEYIKELRKRNSSIQTLTIARNGAGYHDKQLDTPFASATGIRQAIQTGISLPRLSPQLPQESETVLSQYFAENPPLYQDDFSAQLHYKLLCEQYLGYTSYLDVSEDLSDRIRKNLYCFETFGQFCDLLKTKEITYSRISRCLLHILLNIKKNDVDAYIREWDYIPYAKILGLRRDAAPLLSEIDKNSRIPLLSKLADAYKILEEPALDMLKKDIFANDIYTSARTLKSGTPMKNEYSTPIVVI